VSKMKRSSEEEARLDEDAERKRLALIGAMEGARAKWSHIGFIRDVGGCRGSASRRDAHVNDKHDKRGGLTRLLVHVIVFVLHLREICLAPRCARR
jgi:hypothetical protein